MTTLIGWPTTPHTDVKATSFWCHFLLSFLHLMRYKTKMINFSLFVWLKNLKSKIYPFINFLKKQFTLDTPKVKLLWNLFQILCHHPCWIICLKSVALHTIFMAFVLASLWYGHVFFPYCKIWPMPSARHDFKIHVGIKI